MKKFALSAVMIVAFAGSASAQAGSASLLGGAGVAGAGLATLLVVVPFAAITGLSTTSATN